MNTTSKSLYASDDITSTLFELDNVIYKNYLDNLTLMPVVKKKQAIDDVVFRTRLNKINKIIFDPNENNLHKLVSIFSTMSFHGASVIILLQSDGKQTAMYLGTKSFEGNEGRVAIETFERSLQANFPGIEFSDLYGDDIRTICGHINSEETRFITSVSGIPGLKDSNSDCFVQGIEKIVEGMQGKKYTALMMATPVSQQELKRIESGYQDMYSTLSVLESRQITLSENESRTLGETVGTSLSRSLSRTVANSTSESHGSNTNYAEGKSFSSTKSWTGNLNILIAGVSRSSGEAHGSSTSRSYGTTEAKTTGKINSSGETDTYSSTESLSSSQTSQTGISSQYSLKDRRITDILKTIDEQLSRVRKCKNHGMWNMATYFLDSECSTTQMGANLLSGILSGEKTGVERNSIALWDGTTVNRQSFHDLRESLSQFEHPVFDTSSKYSFAIATHTSLVSTEELAVGMSLPQKSLPGIPVFKSVEFGRTVSRYDIMSERKIELGKVQHLGRDCPNLSVQLDIDSLTAHTFITGSTGAGKSNAIYSIIYNLWKKNKIPFLIIEPAKGEYKDIFGGYRAVSIFGTNSDLVNILRINPFSFPEKIHITEHIDRLIEILNAVWPMYAAMPAIIKSATEQAYVRMGWDLQSSTNNYGRIFPDFSDLLAVLPAVIDKSAYSSEIKSNYTGALVTRVESLTNGYFRTIFQKEELSDSILFDKPCIVDLSRVASTETKSLLMGVVFMKLQEYRLSSSTGSNMGLNHITVMEEAHSLLRRTSLDQSMEGSNLQGKAVEMITNAIAEMRTYGEGFIIADQSAGLLDKAVIRNTNTKIILRLPDWDDRELVGKAANLKQEQIEELARLRTGCAAVYQNNWQEAVLCHIEVFDSVNCREQNPAPDILCSVADPRKLVKTDLLKILAKLNKGQNDLNRIDHAYSEDLERAKKYYPEVVVNIFQNKLNEELIISYMKNLMQFDQAVLSVPLKYSGKFFKWTHSLLQIIFSNIEFSILDQKSRMEIIRSVFEICAFEKPKNVEVWVNEFGKEDQWAEAVF